MAKHALARTVEQKDAPTYCRLVLEHTAEVFKSEKSYTSLTGIAYNHSGTASKEPLGTFLLERRSDHLDRR